MRLSADDQMLLQRFLDRELAADEAASLRSRLDREPELAAGFAEFEELSRGFAAGRSAGFVAPAGFTAAVLAEVRKLPDRIRLQEAEFSARAMVLCRRLLLAAAILFGLGLCWHIGLFDGGSATTLEAAPDEIDRVLDQIDAIVRSLKSAEQPR
ncbi:MAG: hypothetical protein KDC98_18925 [Planctomycetes bacterium]|nr:hypothetical protein [Planctomycetota bacterium]